MGRVNHGVFQTHCVLAGKAHVNMCTSQINMHFKEFLFCEYGNVFKKIYLYLYSTHSFVRCSCSLPVNETIDHQIKLKDNQFSMEA